MRMRIVSALVLAILVNSISQASIKIESRGGEGGITQYAKTLLNEKLSALAGDSDKCDLKVSLNVLPEMKEPGDEGYKIEVKEGLIDIHAASERGALYGAIGLIEWLIQNTSPYLAGGKEADIDFAIEPGQAKEFLNKLPNYSVTEKPYYSLRGTDLSNLALGVSDITDVEKSDHFACHYADINGGFKDSAKVWKNWCDWLSRHRMNYISNWPYSCGTNWWELAYDPNTVDMCQYTEEEIKKAAVVREELLKYAKDRGLRPYLMNYVLGAPNPLIFKRHPEFSGPRARPEWPQAFCMSGPALKEKFERQIRAIVRTYPSLGGFHLRWWGESFPCSCDKCKGKGTALLQEYTLAIIKAALEENPDLDIRITGWIRNGGTKEFADKLPSKVIIQTKWGIDWEPTGHPDVPYNRINELKQRFMISQCLPGEEFHPVGGVQYKGLAAGIKKYTNDRAQIPNLEGFAVLAAEKDCDWITAMNFVAAARLDWDPLGTDVNELAKNYIASKLGVRADDAEIVGNTWRAMDLTQDVWESYCVDFGGVVKYLDCYRLWEQFGLERAKKSDAESLKKAVAGMRNYADMMQRAMDCMEKAQKAYAKKNNSAGKAFMEDMAAQTEVLGKWMQGRELMTRAFIAFKSKDYSEAEIQFAAMKSLDEAVLKVNEKKQNISDDFEFEGMNSPFRMNLRGGAEIKEIDDMLKEISTFSKAKSTEPAGQQKL